MKSLFLFLVTVVSLLTGCSQPAETDSINGSGGIIEVISHTRWAIDHFSVNDQLGVDIVGPWQGGGGTGYFGVPPKWEPGVIVKIDWKTDVGDMDGLSGFGDDEKLLSWYRKMELLNREHSLIVPVPDYNGQKTRGTEIHSLPCGKIKVTASRYDYDNPNYPIKDPTKMEEPEVCPK